jgi:hypothetical protein
MDTIMVTARMAPRQANNATNTYVITYFEYGYFIFEQNFVANKMGLIPPCPLLFIYV